MIEPGKSGMTASSLMPGTPLSQLPGVVQLPPDELIQFVVDREAALFELFQDS